MCWWKITSTTLVWLTEATEFFVARLWLVSVFFQMWICSLVISFQSCEKDRRMMFYRVFQYWYVPVHTNPQSVWTLMSYLVADGKILIIAVDTGSCGARWHCTGIEIVGFWYWDVEVYQFNQPLSTSVDITMAWICAVWAYHGHICSCSLFEAVGCCPIKLHQSHFHAGSS